MCGESKAVKGTPGALGTKFYADTMEGELPPEILEELKKMLEEG